MKHGLLQAGRSTAACSEDGIHQAVLLFSGYGRDMAAIDLTLKTRSQGLRVGLGQILCRPFLFLGDSYNKDPGACTANSSLKMLKH